MEIRLRRWQLVLIVLVAAAVTLSAQVRFGDRFQFNNGTRMLSGSADPEGSVTAPAGSIYARTNGDVYRKASGSGNTGWVDFGSGNPFDQDLNTTDDVEFDDLVVGSCTGCGGGGGGGGVVLVEQYTASASAALNFTTGITSTYDEYLFEFVNVVPASNSDLKILVSTNGGSSWDTSNVYRWQNATAWSAGTGQNSGGTATAWLLRGSNSTLTSGGAYNGSIRLYDPRSASLNKTFSGQILIDDNSLGLLIFQWAGTWRTATAVNAIQVSFASGNIASGKVRLYGVEK